MSNVELNECRVNATGAGAQWWTLSRMRFASMGRVAILKSSLGGDVVSIQCDDKEHAQWFVDLAVEQGVPPSAIKVRR